MVLRTQENALQPAPQHGGAPSLDNDELAIAIDVFTAATVDKFRALEIANAELRGKLDAVLQLLGQKSFKAADVIDVPNWRKRDA